MGTKFELNFLRFLFGFSVIWFFKLIKKPPMKDWFIIFFLKGYVSSFLDAIVVNEGYIAYPVKLIKSFNISVIFSYLLYPLTCVYYNQVTRKSNFLDLIMKTLYFTTPMVIVETLLEKYTNLIKWKRTWGWKHSYLTIMGTFLLVRFLMMLIRKAASPKRKRKLFW